MNAYNISPSTFTWSGRLLCLVYAGFLSVFALDVFNEGLAFWDSILALFMHLIPSFLILIIVAFTWKWELVGAITLPVIGSSYIIASYGRFPIPTYLLIAGPLFIAGALFLASILTRKRSLQKE